MNSSHTVGVAGAGTMGSGITIGLQVAVCNDFPGRIVDQLLRPFYNSALRALDEQLSMPTTWI